MANPKNTGYGGSLVNPNEVDINDDVSFSQPDYDPPCPPGVWVINSLTIALSGSGSTCDPLTGSVIISQFAGNSLQVLSDGLYASGGTGGGTNADWNAVSGPAFILNKPTNVSYWINDVGYLTVTSGDTRYLRSVVLTNTQIGFGAGGILSGSNNLTYDSANRTIIVLNTGGQNFAYSSFRAIAPNSATSGNPIYGGAFESIGAAFAGGGSHETGARWYNKPNGTSANVIVFESNVNNGSWTQFASISDSVGYAGVNGTFTGTLTSNLFVANNGTFSGNPSVSQLTLIPNTLIAPASGNIENDGTHLWYTNGSNVRLQLDNDSTTLYISGVTNPIKNTVGVLGLALSPNAGNIIQLLGNGLYASGGTGANFISGVTNPLIVTSGILSLALSATAGNSLSIMSDGLYTSGDTIADIINETRPKQQTLVDGSTISFDYSKGAFGIVTINGNRNISFTNLVIPSFILIKATNGVSGTTITLPGRLNTTFTWGSAVGDTTLIDGAWDGTEWLWVGDLFYTSGSTSGDTDAAAFIAAVVGAGGTVSSGQNTALQTFYTSLKSASLYTRIYAMYLPVFGSAAADKFNMKNPVDSDGAFRLTFSGTITHGSTGMQGDGTTGIADTKFNSHSNASLNSYSIGQYFQGAGGAGGAFYSMGTWDGTQGSYISRGTAVVQTRLQSTNDYTATSTSTRLVIAARTSSTIVHMYRDGTDLGSQSLASTLDPNSNTYLCAANSGIFSDSLFSFAFMSDGLSGSDVTALTSAVNALMTSFGINV